MPPDVVLNEDPKYNEIIEGLPEPGKMQAYKPSLIGKPIRPLPISMAVSLPGSNLKQQVVSMLPKGLTDVGGLLIRKAIPVMKEV